MSVAGYFTELRVLAAHPTESADPTGTAQSEYLHIELTPKRPNSHYKSKEGVTVL